MAEGLGSAGANTALDALFAAYPWIQLHTGAPGANGTTNVATNSTRKQATPRSASGGAASQSNALTWTAVPATETYTKFSAWSLSSGGAFGFSGSVTAGQVASGQNFSVAIDDLDVAFPLAS